MRLRALVVRSLVFSLLSLAPWPADAADLEALAVEALTGSAGSEIAAAELRRAGQGGAEIVAPLLAAFEACSGCDRDRLDRLCGVRDCAEIGLFWHTDLDAALAVAAREDKPVLSLRLMGRLDEELSCANSRFFRTVYYADEAIGQLLAERYVLHWRSVRPVPKVTIDFGDGRRLERTLVGNSLHYVLDSRGRVVEVLPGLTGPEEFRRRLVAGEENARGAAEMNDELFEIWARIHHRERYDEIRAALERDRALPKERSGVLTDHINLGGGETGSKAVFAGPVFQALQPPGDEMLEALAARHRPGVRLDESSRAFLIAKQGAAPGEEAEGLVRSFEATIALDELINRYRLEPAILEHLVAVDSAVLEELESLDAWIYDEVFDQPLDDPWLGLAPRDVYGALPPEMLAAGE